MTLYYTKPNNNMLHNLYPMDYNIIQFKLNINKHIAQPLNIKHIDNFIYTDDDLMCYFSFPLYECPNDMDEDNPNTLTTLNGKYYQYGVNYYIF